MKTMITGAWMLFVAALAGLPAAQAQNARENDKAAITRQLVEGRRFMFIPQTAIPMSGRVRQLTPDFSLTLTKDTIDADLPYFGRAYTAPIDPTQGGIRFTSTSFEYTASPHKKSGWDISIKPKGNQDVQQLQLSVSETGYASLQVLSTNRQAISFNGYIVEVPGKKKRK